VFGIVACIFPQLIEGKQQKISQRAALGIVLIIVVNTDPCTTVSNALLQDHPAEFVHKFALL